MRDLLSDYERFAATGKPFGRAVVTSVWGSAPRPEGSCMLAATDGAIAGSVSGGCVEGATALEFEAAIGAALSEDAAVRTERADRFLAGMSWDRTWSEMRRLVEDVVAMERTATRALAVA